MGPYPFTDVRPAALAHRGGTDLHPENTLAAFEHAIELGYRIVETDVHLTADGHLVAFHDETLTDTSLGGGEISSLTLDEVRRAKIHGPDGAVHHVPLMAEILSSWPNVFVNVDPKSDASVDPLVRLIATTQSVERICVGSFVDARIRRCRRALGPALCTSMGPLEMARMRAGSFGLPTGRFVAGCIQVPEIYFGHRLLDRRLLDAAHSRGLPVQVWTINEAADMHRLLDMGVDALITDRLQLLREVMSERNIWIDA